MSDEMRKLAEEIADLRRDVRRWSDAADRIVMTRIVDDVEVRKLLEEIAGVTV